MYSVHCTHFLYTLYINKIGHPLNSVLYSETQKIAVHTKDAECSAHLGTITDTEIDFAKYLHGLICV